MEILRSSNNASKALHHCKFENEFEKKTREEIYYSGDYADLTFVVGSKETREFKAHRLVLMAGSQKFKKMLDLHKTDKPIVIPEIEPDLFDRLLMAIYLHSFQIDSIETALDCSKLFEDFGLPHAVQQCLEYLNHPMMINPENAITLYEISLQNPEQAKTVEQCLEMFSANTCAVLKSVAFSRAHLDTIVTIFDLPQLSICSEIDLLNALCEFAEMHGALPQHNADGNADRFMELVKPALAKIRLLTLSPDELVRSVSVRSLLTDQEILCILAHSIDPENSLYRLPEGISNCKTSRAAGSEGYQSQYSGSVTNASSCVTLADTARIDSQIYETPKRGNISIQASSIDWTASKIQDVRKKDLMGNGNGSPVHVDTSIEASTIADSSSVVLVEENSITGIVNGTVTLKGTKTVCPKYRCRAYLERKAKTVAEENLEKTKRIRKKRKNQDEKHLPFKKRGRMELKKSTYGSSSVKGQEKLNQSSNIGGPSEILNDTDLPNETPSIDVMEINTHENMTDDDLIAYLVMNCNQKSWLNHVQ